MPQVLVERKVMSTPTGALRVSRWETLVAANVNFVAAHPPLHFQDDSYQRTFPGQQCFRGHTHTLDFRKLTTRRNSRRETRRQNSEPPSVEPYSWNGVCFSWMCKHANLEHLSWSSAKMSSLRKDLPKWMTQFLLVTSSCGGTPGNSFKFRLVPSLKSLAWNSYLNGPQRAYSAEKSALVRDQTVNNME